jgi:O-antigen/teichoic acid export membrane protein
VKLISFGRRHSATGFGLVAQALQYGSALMLLPFLVTRLTAAEVGIWYVFVTVQSLALLADFGFQPTVARAFASAFGGARELRTTGLVDEAAQSPNYLLARQILRAARWLYLGLALTVCVVLLSVGTVYVGHIATGHVPDLFRVRLAWMVFAIGSALNLYLVWVSPLMLGSGRVAQNYQFIIVSRGGFALLGIIALVAGGGLLALAFANLAAGIGARIFASWLMRPLKPLLAGPIPAGSVRIVLGKLWPNAGRMGLVALSGFLITRVNVLILSSFAGLQVAAGYAISLQLLTAAGMMAMLPTQVTLPNIVELRLRGEWAALRKLLAGRLAFFFMAYITAAVIIVMLGQPVFGLVGSKVQLLPHALLALLALVVMLEMNHSNAAFIITTANDVPFVLPSLLSAAAIVLLSTVSVWAGAGALGAIVSQGVVQAAFNNWKWPLVAWRGLHDRRI